MKHKFNSENIQYLHKKKQRQIGKREKHPVRFNLCHAFLLIAAIAAKFEGVEEQKMMILLR